MLCHLMNFCLPDGSSGVNRIARICPWITWSVYGLHILRISQVRKHPISSLHELHKQWRRYNQSYISCCQGAYNGIVQAKRKSLDLWRKPSFRWECLQWCGMQISWYYQRFVVQTQLTASGKDHCSSYIRWKSKLYVHMNCQKNTRQYQTIRTDDA